MWTVFWESLVLAFFGTLILRIGGRKAVSEMTIPQFAILLTIGAVLGSEVSGKGLAESILATATFVGFLVLSEWIGLKWDGAETVLQGKSVPVIVEGQVQINNLKKLRLTVDDLEKRLRLAGISRITDVKTGTMEVNGQFGYELMEHARPVTMGDLERLLKGMEAASEKKDIFTEVIKGPQSNVPEQLH